MMRLLQLDPGGGLSITEDLVADIPPYAILSHRWLADHDEVTFKDIKKGLGTNKAGYQKLVSCGAQAQRDGISHFWADTCCIDKRSSAELSEAINSMFQWYRKSQVCYVYLADIDHRCDITTSVWFHRGWTLQELLAPSNVMFFAKDWTFLSDKTSMLGELAEHTRIDQEALAGFQGHDFSVMEKMSWAAKRTTTRVEDLAYCLLGLFDVNIPLIYGEGARAFTRLQLAIMDQDTDLSIFVWTGRASDDFGMLAAEPRGFSIQFPASEITVPPRWAYHCGSILTVPDITRRDFKLHEGWTYNNAGISLQLWLTPLYLDEKHRAVFVAWLRGPYSHFMVEFGIFLQSINHSTPRRRFKRIAVDGHTVAGPGCVAIPYRPAHYQFVIDLAVNREPMTASTSTGYHMFSIKLEGKGLSSKHVHVFKRPTDKGPASKGCDPLRSWSVVKTESAAASDISLGHNRNDLLGIFAFILITSSDAVPVLLFLGYNPHLKPICITIPCLLDHLELDSWDVFSAYSRRIDSVEDGLLIFDADTMTYLSEGLETRNNLSLYEQNLNVSLGRDFMRVEICAKFGTWMKTATRSKHVQKRLHQTQSALFGRQFN